MPTIGSAKTLANPAQLGRPMNFGSQAGAVVQLRRAAGLVTETMAHMVNVVCKISCAAMGHATNISPLAALNVLAANRSCAANATPNTAKEWRLGLCCSARWNVGSSTGHSKNPNAMNGAAHANEIGVMVPTTGGLFRAPSPFVANNAKLATVHTVPAIIQKRPLPGNIKNKSGKSRHRSDQFTDVPSNPCMPSLRSAHDPNHD